MCLKFAFYSIQLLQILPKICIIMLRPTSLKCFYKCLACAGEIWYLTPSAASNCLKLRSKLFKNSNPLRLKHFYLTKRIPIITFEYQLLTLNLFTHVKLTAICDNIWISDTDSILIWLFFSQKLVECFRILTTCILLILAGFAPFLVRSPYVIDVEPVQCLVPWIIANAEIGKTSCSSLRHRNLLLFANTLEKDTHFLPELWVN